MTKTYSIIKTQLSYNVESWRSIEYYQTQMIQASGLEAHEVARWMIWRGQYFYSIIHDETAQQYQLKAYFNTPEKQSTTLETISTTLVDRENAEKLLLSQRFEKLLTLDSPTFGYDIVADDKVTEYQEKQREYLAHKIASAG